MPNSAATSAVRTSATDRAHHAAAPYGPVLPSGHPDLLSEPAFAFPVPDYAAAVTLWTDVDEPVLRWVASLPPSLEMQMFDFELDEPKPFEPIEGLETRQVHDALARLASHGLIDSRESPTMGQTSWHALRVTARGLIVLEEWPDLDRVASAAAIHRLLTLLADGAPEEEKPALRRAAGAVSRTASEVITGVVVDIAGRAGGETADL